ncbi:MAG: GNAT family N-acetyltransferase [Flavobacteriales bacterium]|nr:GNAT family N-acetyltransferase [Flavobacteriales bacterium]
MIVLTTERLILREFELTDAEAMFNLNSDEEVLRYTGDKQFESIEDANNFFKNYPDYEKNGFGRWALVTKGDKEVIGWCGLKKHEDNTVDIGYRIFKNQWNKGYATEASIACLEYGFQVFELDEIIANAATENKASIRVMEKIGMEFQQNMACEGIEDAVRYIKKNNLL